MVGTTSAEKMIASYNNIIGISDGLLTKIGGITNPKAAPITSMT